MGMAAALLPRVSRGSKLPHSGGGFFLIQTSRHLLFASCVSRLA